MDTVGERWALLVVRELLLGPKRFGDLSAGLPHASQNVLSQRLKELDSAGLIRRVKMGPPVSAHVYELTDIGRGLEPALIALARWGAILPAAPNATMSPDAVALGLKALYSPSPDDALRTETGLRLGDDPYFVRIRPEGIQVGRGQATAPSLVVKGSAIDVWNLVAGEYSLSEALKAGTITIDGDVRDAEKFFALFAVPRGAVELTDAT